MQRCGIVAENQLDEWVRGHSEIAGGVIVELVWRLVSASCPRPRDRRFPLGDSIGQSGPDGLLDTDFGFSPFVPEGKSQWEVGVGIRARDKATSDYKELTENTPEEIRRESTFVFVTPLSGRRGWEYTWKQDAQSAWLQKRRQRGEWLGVWGRFRRSGWQWVDAVDVSQWSPVQIGQFLACLPFEPETWNRTTVLLGQDESPYWARAAVNPYGVEKNGVGLAVDHLLEYGRPYAAIRCLAAMCHLEQPLNSKQAVRALMSTQDSSEDPHATDAHDFREVIKALQESEDADPEDLFQVEWAYLPFLDHDQGSYPKLLEQRLADDPAFFCEAIRIVYRSKKEEEPKKEATQNQKDIGSNVYRLLHGWRRPPGTKMDGTFDGDALLVWLDEVKQHCSESGHLDVALLMVGQIFAHMPADPDGLWIHRVAADVLNAPDAEDMRNGYTTQLYNMRGIHSFTAGREEKEIAQKYRRQAEEVEAQGYHRFATALKRLAAQYDREGEREETRDPFE